MSCTRLGLPLLSFFPGPSLAISRVPVDVITGLHANLFAGNVTLHSREKVARVVRTVYQSADRDSPRGSQLASRYPLSVGPVRHTDQKGRDLGYPASHFLHPQRTGQMGYFGSQPTPADTFCIEPCE